ncbi:glyoxalase [Solihabitans fulvus]|uniref:Glyoxalase n=1 Tax=Solihabitans fulvus TaxID=1892852 RepID=A0A5B2WT76_9PSEU|nr:VOC family protein [Solihabitans fulvus]KAA2253619.1 glyoxalase [Solihabitans fulvus]
MNVVASTVSLHVDDVAASSRFFTTHLGFREIEVVDDFTWLGRDDSAPDILLQPRDLELPSQPPCGHGSAHVIVSFTVTGIAGEHERLRREGANITLSLRQERWGEWLLRLTDPNGVVVQLVEWVPPAGA